MSCQICLCDFDHSIHRPFSLSSCPHTFCIDCINRFPNPKCPTCCKPIENKHPNLALLELIPESSDDKLKTEKQLMSKLRETNELKKKLDTVHDHKLRDNFFKIKSIKKEIKQNTENLIELLKANEYILLNETNEIENNMVNELSKLKIDDYFSRKIENLKSEFEMESKSTRIIELNSTLIYYSMKIESFNDDYSHLLKHFGDWKTSILSGINIDKLYDVFIQNAINEKETDKHIFYIDKAIELFPDKADAYSLKGDFFLSKTPSIAIDCFKKCTDLEPNNFDHHYKLAKLFIKEEKWRESLDSLNRAIVLEPSYHCAHSLKGDTLVLLKEYKEANDCFTKALELDSKNREYQMKKDNNLRNLHTQELKVKKAKPKITKLFYSKKEQL